MNETITWITDGSLPDSDTTGRLVECEDPFRCHQCRVLLWTSNATL